MAGSDIEAQEWSEEKAKQFACIYLLHQNGRSGADPHRSR